MHAPREIEFLKKETAQRRVLEESELARKEEMDKLLDKVGWCEGQHVSPHLPTPLGILRGGVLLLARSLEVMTGGGKGAGRMPSAPPCFVFFQISELEGNLQTLRNSNST